MKKYGILPQQYVDFAVMRGDASDGLPGVKGVGDKTAASLLQQYADLAGIRAAAADPSTKMATGLRAKLTDAGDYLDVAPTVVAVARDLTLPDLATAIRPLDGPGVEVVSELQESWGLGGSVTAGPASLRQRHYDVLAAPAHGARGQVSTSAE